MKRKASPLEHVHSKKPTRISSILLQELHDALPNVLISLVLRYVEPVWGPELWCLPLSFPLSPDGGGLTGPYHLGIQERLVRWEKWTVNPQNGGSQPNEMVLHANEAVVPCDNGRIGIVGDVVRVHNLNLKHSKEEVRWPRRGVPTAIATLFINMKTRYFAVGHDDDVFKCWLEAYEDNECIFHVTLETGTRQPAVTAEGEFVYVLDRGWSAPTLMQCSAHDGSVIQSKRWTGCLLLDMAVYCNHLYVLRGFLHRREMWVDVLNAETLETQEVYVAPESATSIEVCQSPDNERAMVAILFGLGDVIVRG